MGLLSVGLLPQRTQLQERTARIILCADYTTPSSDNNNNNNKKTVDPIFLLHITRTCLYNFDALQPHFYIAKLGLKGVYIIFLISAQKHRLWVLVRTAPPRRFQRVPTIYVSSKNIKNIRIFSENFHFLMVKISVYLNRHVFVMSRPLIRREANNSDRINCLFTCYTSIGQLMLAHWIHD